jgi:hypothetical protein
MRFHRDLRSKAIAEFNAFVNECSWDMALFRAAGLSWNVSISAGVNPIKVGVVSWLVFPANLMTSLVMR